MNEDENKFEKYKNKKSKLPFAVFVCSNAQNDGIVEQYLYVQMLKMMG